MKIIKYIISLVAAAVLLTLVCSANLRNELVAIWVAATGDAVDKLELQADQGSLALQHFDSVFKDEQQRLRIWTQTSKDNLQSMRAAKARAAALRAQGKENMAIQNDEAAAYYEGRVEFYEQKVQHHEAKLIELKGVRECAREEVRLLRERIAILSSTREALDSQDMQEMLDRAEQNVRNLQRSCNKLSAEIEVLSLTED